MPPLEPEDFPLDELELLDRPWDEFPSDDLPPEDLLSDEVDSDDLPVELSEPLLAVLLSAAPAVVDSLVDDLPSDDLLSEDPPPEDSELEDFSAAACFL